MGRAKPQHTLHICDDCQFAVWHDAYWNRTPEGLPITLRCEHYKGGQVGIVRGSVACVLFKQKFNY